MTLWLSTQTPHLERSFVAQVLGFPENKLRIVSKDVGGGFGCKIDTYPETIIASILAMQVARPVKWVEDRQEHFVSTIHGRGQVQYVDAAYSKDGILLGMRLRFYTDLGAYSSGGTHLVAAVSTPAGAVGVYKIQNLAWTASGVFTNKVPVGPYRGYGQHATAYLIERIMDLIARELAMDPVEIRRKNFIPADAFPYLTPLGREFDSGDYAAAFVFGCGYSLRPAAAPRRLKRHRDRHFGGVSQRPLCHYAHGHQRRAADHRRCGLLPQRRGRQ